VPEYREYEQGWIDRYKAAYAAVHGEAEAANLLVEYNRGWYKIGIGDHYDKNVRVQELAELCENLEQRAVEKQADVLSMDDYQMLAMRTAMKTDGKKPVPAYLGLGLTGEAGEIAEMIKKGVYHGHQLDRFDMRDELGDLLWYLAVTADRFGWNLGEVAERNIAKLRKRYPDGFSQEASRNREE
jgi:NTP pyrophosphatase (non-canonical NTP hydrolase)